MEGSEINLMSKEMNYMASRDDKKSFIKTPCLLPTYYKQSDEKTQRTDACANQNIIETRTKYLGEDPEKRMRTSGFEARKIISLSYMCFAFVLVYHILEHGANQTQSSYFTLSTLEWIIIVLDIAFDAVSTAEFEGLEIRVVCVPESLEKATS